MNRIYKYRLYPNKAQTEMLDLLLENTRLLYNDALAERKWMWDRSRKALSFMDQQKRFQQEHHCNPDTYGLLNATATIQILRQLDKAYSACWRRIKEGEKPGFPRFKKYGRFKSMTYRYGNGCKLRESDGRIKCYIQNVGEVRIKLHRPIPETAVIKQIIFKRNVDKWHACLVLEMFDFTHEEKPIVPETAVGIDVGIKSLLALSSEELIENPRWFREAQRDLKKKQRRLARRKRGSKRRRKAAAQVAKQHEYIANQRLDFWHKVTTDLVERFDTIVIEDLNLAFMTQNGNLSLSAHDAGLGIFKELIAYKAEEAGVRLIRVNPRNTSQLCSGCGTAVPKSLSVRVHKCDECGLEIDRDVNAARNILALGMNSDAPGRGVQVRT